MPRIGEGYTTFAAGQGGELSEDKNEKFVLAHDSTGQKPDLLIRKSRSGNLRIQEGQTYGDGGVARV
jgi:hypothetical protein